NTVLFLTRHEQLYSFDTRQRATMFVYNITDAKIQKDFYRSDTENIILYDRFVFEHDGSVYFMGQESLICCKKLGWRNILDNVVKDNGVLYCLNVAMNIVMQDDSLFIAFDEDKEGIDLRVKGILQKLINRTIPTDPAEGLDECMRLSVERLAWLVVLC